jgi:hypothetical protein
VFADASFSEISFADFFISSGAVFYEFRKGRTTVIANVPDDGKIINDIPKIVLRTKVEIVKTRNIVPS